MTIFPQTSDTIRAALMRTETRALIDAACRMRQQRIAALCHAVRTGTYQATREAWAVVERQVEAELRRQVEEENDNGKCR